MLFAFCLLFVKYPSANLQETTDRIFKNGDVIIGSLLAAHQENSEEGCRNVHLIGIIRVEAAIYTIEQINKNANILPNIQLGYDIRDHCMDRAKAMKHTYDFSTHIQFLEMDEVSNNHHVNSNACLQSSLSKSNTALPISAIVGPYGSRNSLQVAGLLQVVNIPAISPSATSAELSWSFYKKFLRTVPPDGYQARAMADLIEHFSWKYVAVIAVEHSYGLYGFRALEQESFQRQTFCIGLVEYITPTQYDSQLKPTVAKLKRAENIKVIILWIGATLAKELAKEAHSQNLIGKVWVMSDSLATKTPEYLGNDLISLGIYLGIQPKQFQDRNFEEYLKHLTAKISSERRNVNPWFDVIWREEFNCSTNNGTQGYVRCQDNLTITDEVFSKMSDDFIPYQIDAIYAVARALDMIYKCKTPLGLLPNGACPQTKPFVRSSDVFLYLRNVSFQGITGRIGFDENGDPLQAMYDFVSFQKNFGGNYVKIKIGFWEANGDLMLQINDSLIKWSNGNGTLNRQASGIPKSICLEPCPPGTRQTPTISCCWQCIECPDGAVNARKGSPNCTKCAKTQKSSEDKTTCVDLPIKNLHWKSMTGIILAIFTTSGFVFTFFTTVLFIRYYHTPVVKAANRDLSFILLSDIAAGFVLPLLTISYPSPAICAVIEPWRYITSSLSVSVLLVKTMKLLRAFQITYVAKWLRKSSASSVGQFVSIISLNFIQVIFAVIWGAVDPPFTRNKIEEGLFVTIICIPYRTSLGQAMEISMLTYMLFLCLLCVFYAFKARTLPENFNEARYIGFAMYILLLSWIAFVPVQTSLGGCTLRNV
ncbi:Extracellular calcium-sensing receptor [Stylophora pistillata]|uniref:Extracellular calcium-sensing receptor n=1 Tax=Stylophora pistillata TaxID=50429 RepID=A0A2B4T2L0_STYPI|nr:Extracellular calcium-sensing receptor [Stylophora pistillata]